MQQHMGAFLTTFIHLSEQQKLFQEEMKTPSAAISKCPLGLPLGDKPDISSDPKASTSALPLKPLNLD